MYCQPLLLEASDLIEKTPEFEEILIDLSLEDFEMVCEHIFEIFRDVMGYIAAMMHDRLAEYLSESPKWSKVGSEIVRSEVTELTAPFQFFTLGFTVERNRGRIVLNGLERHCAA